MDNKIDFKNLSPKEKSIFRAGCISTERKLQGKYQQGVDDVSIVAFIDNNSDWFDPCESKSAYDNAKARLRRTSAMKRK